MREGKKRHGANGRVVKRGALLYKNLDTEDHDLSSDVSSSSLLNYDIVDISSQDFENIIIVMEQAGFLAPSEDLVTSFVHLKVVVYDNLALAFGGFVPLEEALKLSSKNKNARNALDSFSSVFKKKNIQKERVHVFHTGRICNAPLALILSMYRKVEHHNFEHIMFISKVNKCNRPGMEEALRDFPEYNTQDLEYIPTRMEEIFLLSSNLSKKLVVVSGEDFRLFLINSQMFSSFIDAFERELLDCDRVSFA